MIEGKYHSLVSCNNCGDNTNEVTVVLSSNYGIEECKTKCNSCGFEDMWCYGFYLSSSDPDGIESKCEKY